MIRYKKLKEQVFKNRLMNSKFLLVLIIIVAFAVRLYRIDSPVADWHSWRQADTSAVTRNFSKFGFNPLFPRYDDLSNIQTGVDNPEGYRFVEFPVYQSFVFMLSKLAAPLPISLEVWHRIVSILASLGSLYLIYELGKRYANERVGLISASFYAILPYSIYYSRVILPEVFLGFFMLLTLYLFSKAIVPVNPSEIQHSFASLISFLFPKKSLSVRSVAVYPEFLLASAISAALALLIKPVSIFFLLPIIYFWFQYLLFSRKYVLYGITYLLIMVVPLVAWRLWIQQFPEGIPAWTWLLNGDQVPYNNLKLSEWIYHPLGIRFKGAFFRWLFAERLTKLILGYSGVAFLVLGILAKKGIKQKLFFHMLGLGALLYITVFAGGNVRHDYYQVITLPIVVLYAGMGVDFLLTNRNRLFDSISTYAMIVVLVGFTLAFSWFEIRGYYWINNPAIVEAGIQADQLLPEQAKVIAPYGGDTAFLYQINRQGWPIGFEIEDKIAKGATHYVSVSPQDPEALDLKERYTVLAETDSYIIINLQ
ncbi:MAG: PMT family glycosyltransferase, 4-amino-4-deoxy-L-arabinose transferase [Microgenomates group bacterium GW2011_GWC1_41_8]|uniref:PMT family glycosyltransferase, 4-amino-4-deoxy-L-arabinose transferase n=2 Tax=Candidatus Roizmaniibacteriota TaxID=1752723 RepID=A0A0G1A7R3_9BACT|nr:MAG: PMT family glycosyltransferase, 4-amino-4-deoxy-L-arabinose transferase [Candidatus Levybacteria bacterium GW2011_GWA2_40_16]KKR95013.1 MAG: PMT family glycosyltransferase, 4-amino-4-deoxy-L-arabinose transferase [Candidatus Roizmanbacteria bacterium GW2011_GWA1_41_13]KKS21368.1 MAG: PMT family glycosyltransferase, 4-amino-4-deoxy-L-arabinose transferase [Candidatus Roizmanbacteria bacterium GW2011_GWC2_41_7]KKS24767.1 MAG: PMT family glycosyltransferase, 4-amino-4-deoxy-L-arabinose tran